MLLPDLEESDTTLDKATITRSSRGSSDHVFADPREEEAASVSQTVFRHTVPLRARFLLHVYFIDPGAPG